MARLRVQYGNASSSTKDQHSEHTAGYARPPQFLPIIANSPKRHQTQDLPTPPPQILMCHRCGFERLRVGPVIWTSGSAIREASLGDGRCSNLNRPEEKAERANQPLPSLILLQTVPTHEMERKLSGSISRRPRRFLQWIKPPRTPLQFAKHPAEQQCLLSIFKLKRRPGRLNPLEESPGTPRNRTGEFPLHLVRGGPSVVRSSWVEAGWHAPLFPLGDSNLSTAPSPKEASR